MANYNSNLKTWGATGSEYPDGYSYEAGDQPVDAWDNYVNSNLVNDIQHLIALTNDRIETDSGTSGNEPASPENGHFYYDTTNERLKVWDSTAASWVTFLDRGGDSMNGVLDMSGYQIEDSGGNLTLASTVNVTGTLKESGNNVATETWVNNNADVPNANYADSAGDANTLDGNDSSYFATSGHAHSLGDLSNVSASGEGTGNNFDADTVDGDHASAFASSGHSHALGDLSNVSATGEGSGNGFDADMLDGNHASYFTTLTEVNNNADVPNADYADTAGDADTVDGNDASELGMAMGKMDSAETFAESDVTLQRDATRVEAEGVALTSAENETDSIGGPQTESMGQFQQNGFYFTLRERADITQATLLGNTTSITRVEIWDGTDSGNVLWSKEGSWSGGDTITIGTTLDGGDYTLAGSDETQGWTAGYDYDGASAGDLININDFNAPHSSGDPGCFGSVSAEIPATTSGSVTVEWPDPPDVYAWDRATFQRTLNDGSVEVYVEANDGSGWMEVAGPISRGESIPADPGDEVRIRADLSRPAPGDASPTLDAVYRRYEV